MSCSLKGCGFGKSFRDTHKDQRIEGLTRLLEKKLKSPQRRKSPRRLKSKRSKHRKHRKSFGRKSRKSRKSRKHGRRKRFGYQVLRSDQIIDLVYGNKVYENKTYD